MLKAVLSNPVHPEYGGITIPFPISREEYDHTMELLEGIDIGDVLRQDCNIAELDSSYSILKRLENATVNVDELDYHYRFFRPGADRPDASPEPQRRCNAHGGIRQIERAG